MSARRASPLALVVAALVGLALLTPATLALAPAEGDDGDYAATIRRTEGGIPHIVADDYGGLGYGFGYAFAQDNICTAADFYVTVRGERSRFFGPEETWEFRGNGTTHANLDSDTFYRAINQSGRIEELVAQAPPHGPSEDLREGVRGYVAGYNDYLADVGGPNGIDDPRCAGEQWVRPISELDAYRRFYQLASLASTGIAISGIGSADPPTPDHGLLGDGDDGDQDGDAGAGGDAEDGGAAGAAGPTLDATAPGGPDAPTDAQRELVDRLDARWSQMLGIGSNAYGFGAETTDDGTGLVLGNPHFPWRDGERLYQSHLTIPGEVDVQGASLYGVPIVLIGTTEGLAWSHTVSTAFRFTPFELTLVPGSPTTYLVDGEPREMERREVTVPVAGEDGEQEVERTVYWTDHGPVITEILGLPLFPWTPRSAYAMGDANDHMRYLNHFFEKNHAQDVDELAELTDRNLGIPWVNTIAADRDGRAYYADVSVVPNVPDEKVQACPTALGAVTFAALGLPVLDGSRSDCEWDTDADAPAEGVFGPGNLPRLVRDDFVHNGNDSYWLSNPLEPLTGFDRIIGDEETPRPLRTRVGLRMVLDRLAGEDLHTDLDAVDRWTNETLRAATLDNRQYAGELMRDDLVEHCSSLPPTIPSSGGPVSTEGACEALAGWDVRDELDSTGAILFRRFVSNLQSMTSPVGDPTGTGLLGLPWREPFDPEDPVDTPNTLNTADPRVTLALGDAIDDLEGAGIPLDAPLGDWQFSRRGEVEIPIHGGPGGVGVFNAINVSWQGDPDQGPVGYPDVPHGTSFVMVAGWSEDEDDCVVQADALVTYGQSEDVTSPWFADQTRRFSDKDWLPMRFCRDDVLEHTIETLHLGGGADHEDEDPNEGTPGGPDEPGQNGRDRADERAGDRGEHGRDRAGVRAEPAGAAGLPDEGIPAALVALGVLGVLAGWGASRLARAGRTPGT